MSDNRHFGEYISSHVHRVVGGLSRVCDAQHELIVSLRAELSHLQTHMRESHSCQVCSSLTSTSTHAYTLVQRLRETSAATLNDSKTTHSQTRKPADCESAHESEKQQQLRLSPNQSAAPNGHVDSSLLSTMGPQRQSSMIIGETPVSSSLDRHQLHPNSSLNFHSQNVPSGERSGAPSSGAPPSSAAVVEIETQIPSDINQAHSVVTHSIPAELQIETQPVPISTQEEELAHRPRKRRAVEISHALQPSSSPIRHPRHHTSSMDIDPSTTVSSSAAHMPFFELQQDPYRPSSALQQSTSSSSASSSPSLGHTANTAAAAAGIQPSSPPLQSDTTMMSKDSPSSNVFKQLRREALAAHKAKDFSNAIILMKRAIEMIHNEHNDINTSVNNSKHIANCYLHLAASYRLNDELDAAIESATQAVKIDPSSVRSVSTLATLYSYKGEYGQALKLMGRAVQLPHIHAADDMQKTRQKLAIIEHKHTKYGDKYVQSAAHNTGKPKPQPDTVAAAAAAATAVGMSTSTTDLDGHRRGHGRISANANTNTNGDDSIKPPQNDGHIPLLTEAALLEFLGPRVFAVGQGHCTTHRVSRVSRFRIDPNGPPDIVAGFTARVQHAHHASDSKAQHVIATVSFASDRIHSFSCGCLGEDTFYATTPEHVHKSAPSTFQRPCSHVGAGLIAWAQRERKRYEAKPPSASTTVNRLVLRVSGFDVETQRRERTNSRNPYAADDKLHSMADAMSSYGLAKIRSSLYANNQDMHGSLNVVTWRAVYYQLYGVPVSPCSGCTATSLECTNSYYACGGASNYGSLTMCSTVLRRKDVKTRPWVRK
jgi:hypothetical protein